VSRVGADTWRVQTATGATVATRQLDNLGVYNDAVAVGGGGYAAVSNSNVVFVGADGNSVNAVVPDSATLMATLSNGNVVGRLAGDNWRMYSPTGSILATRQLDNLGVYNQAVAIGAGGYLAASNSRLVFMGADGTTVNNVLVDVALSLTTLTSGNVVGRVGADVWKVYDPSGAVLATRVLDHLGTFAGAAAVGGGGYVAYSDTNAIFIGSDGLTVNAVVPNSLEFVTTLSNGNVVGKLAGTDFWRLYSPLGSILETRLLDGLGTFTGAAPTSLAVAVPEASSWELILASVGLAGCLTSIRFRRQSLHPPCKLRS
jgi:hypothetical protein